MIQFREKLYNASTNDTRPGNLLDTSLYDEVEQIMIDSSVKDVQYYYVRTPDSVWRKTEYYEILHALIFKVNDTVYQTLYFRTGEAISDTAIEYTAPGMEFQGWTDSIPAVMPDFDVIINGTATAVQYTIAYFIDSALVHFEEHNYNDTLTAYVPDALDGYSFGGWVDFPSSGKMPANNIEVHGSYVENDTYTLTYYIGTDVYDSVQYREGDPISPADEPEDIEVGYSFSGWVDEPEVMPAYNASVNSSLIPNNYLLDYFVDSSLWKSLEYAYNSSIIHQVFERENYIFYGWENEPEVMPAIDHYAVNGSTAQVLYNLQFYSDSSTLYANYNLHYGEQVPQIECNKEGYIFKSWEPELPATMPSYDISTLATYYANSYQLKFITVNYYNQIENLVYDMQVGTVIDSSLYPKPEQYFKYKYVSENAIPEVMPANDLIIYGRYELIDASTEGFIQWYIDGEKLTNGVYQYDTSVYAPISEEEQFIYLWGQYEAFTMPHVARMDIYGERGIIPGQFSKVQWYLDNDTLPILTEVKEWDTLVTAPVSEEDDFNYEWGIYSSFNMPHFAVNAHGTRVAKTIPVPTSHTVYWYLDSSLFTSAVYDISTYVTSPVSSEEDDYNYDWGSYASFVMPNYDISIYGTRVAKTIPATSGTVYWYLDSSLFRQGVYQYDTYVMSPESNDIKYVYDWGSYELFEMPHNDISVYGTSTKVGGTVTWYLDNVFFSEGSFLYDASVNSPTSVEQDYDYDWNGYDTFVMPHYDTSVHGVREAKVVPVSSHTVTWYLDNVYLDSSVFETGSTVKSPVSAEADYNYDWGNYAYFTMPDYDTSVYGVREAKPQGNGTVYWRVQTTGGLIKQIDTSVCAWNSIITSPVSKDAKYTYDWNGKDTFVMPTVEEYLVQGTQITNTIPSGYHVAYWRLNNSIFDSSIIATGTRVYSPVSESPEYWYNWVDGNQYPCGVFTMPDSDITIYGEQVEREVGATYSITWTINSSVIKTDTFLEGTFVEIDNYIPVSTDHDYNYVYPYYIYGYKFYITYNMTWDGQVQYKQETHIPETIDSSGMLFGVALTEYDTNSDTVPSIYYDIPVDYNDSSKGNYYTYHNGFAYMNGVKFNSTNYTYPCTISIYGQAADAPDIDLDVDICLQYSTNGTTWQKVNNSNREVFFPTNNIDTTQADENGYVYIDDISESRIYLRLAIDSIKNEVARNKANTNYPVYMILSDRRTTERSFPYANQGDFDIYIGSDNKAKVQLFGEFDNFYGYILDQIRNWYHLQIQNAGGIYMQLMDKVKFAHNAIERNINTRIQSNNYIGIDNYNPGSYIVTPPLVRIDTSTYKVDYNHRFENCIDLRQPILIPQHGEYYDLGYMYKNCKSLTTGGLIPSGASTNIYHLGNMFEKCTSLTVPPPQIPDGQVVNVQQMFMDCHTLVSGPQMPPHPYTVCTQMFENCYKLVNAPDLPAPVVGDVGYGAMFRNCSALKTPPRIDATVFGSGACNMMFAFCTSLTSRTVLNVIDASANAFDQMYVGCTSLPPES